MTTTEPGVTTFDADTAGKVAAYKAVCSQIKALEATKAELRADIEIALGDNETGVIDGTAVVRNTFVKTNRLNQRALKATLPEVWANFVEPSESRRFTIVED